MPQKNIHGTWADLSLCAHLHDFACSSSRRKCSGRCPTYGPRVFHSLHRGSQFSVVYRRESSHHFTVYTHQKEVPSKIGNGHFLGGYAPPQNNRKHMEIHVYTFILNFLFAMPPHDDSSIPIRHQPFFCNKNALPSASTEISKEMFEVKVHVVASIIIIWRRSATIPLTPCH